MPASLVKSTPGPRLVCHESCDRCGPNVRGPVELTSTVSGLKLTVCRWCFRTHNFTDDWMVHVLDAPPYVPVVDAVLNRW